MCARVTVVSIGRVSARFLASTCGQSRAAPWGATPARSTAKALAKNRAREKRRRGEKEELDGAEAVQAKQIQCGTFLRGKVH
jgi:hypothetical protein